MPDERTREEIYDADIHPMMVKIIQICKDADIPMVADFALDDDRGSDDAEGLHCTTSICPADANDKSKRISAAAEPAVKSEWAAFTVHADGRREQVAGSNMKDEG